jgi:hypothetical protein
VKRKCIRLISFYGLLVWSLGHGLAFAEEGRDGLVNSVGKIAPQIESIDTNGSWTSKEYQGGHYRLVQGHTDGSDLLYLQWIGYPKGIDSWATGDAVLVATQSIAELNEPESEFEILSIKWSVVQEKVLIKVKVLDSMEEPSVKKELTITPGLPGKYTGIWKN